MNAQQCVQEKIQIELEPEVAIVFSDMNELVSKLPLVFVRLQFASFLRVQPNMEYRTSDQNAWLLSLIHLDYLGQVKMFQQVQNPVQFVPQGYKFVLFQHGMQMLKKDLSLH
jgi:hypothetical protein